MPTGPKGKGWPLGERIYDALYDILNFLLLSDFRPFGTHSTPEDVAATHNRFAAIRIQS